MSYFLNIILTAYSQSVQVLSSLALTLVVLALTACSNAPRELQVATVQTEILEPQSTPLIPNPKPVILQDVDWIVLTPSEIPEGDDWAFIALTPKDYEVLSLNQAELLRWITEARWRLKYYRGELPAYSTKPGS